MIPETSTPGPLSNQRTRLRLIGIVVLFLGFGAAGALYLIRTRSEDARVADYAAAQSRAQSRQMGILYGKSGVMIEDLEDDLRQPGTQAALIAALAVLIAGGCFYFAGRSGLESPNGHETKSPVK